MELLQLESVSALPVTQSRGSSSSNVATAKFDYAKILAEKIASAKDDMEQMSKTQEELDKNAELQEELTGKSKDQDGNVHLATETIKKIMPDGSIVFLKIKGGEIIEQFTKKPHYVAVADPSAPKTASGHIAIKMQMKQKLDLFSLLI